MLGLGCVLVLRCDIHYEGRVVHYRQVIDADVNFLRLIDYQKSLSIIAVFMLIVDNRLNRLIVPSLLIMFISLLLKFNPT